MMRTLAYFDTVNFADRVRCRALVGVGLPRRGGAARHGLRRRQPHGAAAGGHGAAVSHSDDLEERQWVRFDSRWTAAVAAGLAGRA